MDKQIDCDLLVVGAGIYGAWTAYDASLRGLKVLLIDKGDIACATSSTSSKLIHGGLRYLEQFNFSLVRKTLNERQRLLQMAPHRVQYLRFGIPIYENSRVSSWKFKAALWLYDWLANLKDKYCLHESLKKETFSERFPFLKTAALKKGFSYVDALTDDARFTLEIVDGAINSGTTLKTYCALSQYVEDNGKISGAELTDTISGELIKVNCKAAVNATGRFTDNLLSTQNCRLTKGVHLILPSTKIDEALLLLSPIDGRVFFVIPWYGKTMLGTTDTDYQGDLNNVCASEDDKDYLLKSVNHYLENSWSQDDIISSFAGLRVLKASSSAKPSSVSRDWEYSVLENGLFVTAGGKFTSAREDSSTLVDAVCKSLKIPEKCETTSSPFPWTPNGDFHLWEEKLIELGRELLLRDKHVKTLIKRQGKRAELILNMIKSNNELAQPVVEGLQFTKAEWTYVLKNEYIKSFEDLIRRRFPILLLTVLNENTKQELFDSANQTLSDSELPLLDKM